MTKSIKKGKTFENVDLDQQQGKIVVIGSL